MSVLLAFTPLLVMAAPVPKQAPPLYFPTKAGTERVYLADKLEIVEVVTDVVDKDEAKVVTVELKVKGETTEKRVFLVSEKGLSTTRIAQINLDEPLCLLKTPSPPGGMWEAVMKGPIVGEVVFKATASKAERVEVPAGIFEAIPVKMEFTVDGKKVTSTSWYAPGVGPVKEELGEFTRVLKSITPGKE